MMIWPDDLRKARNSREGQAIERQIREEYGNAKLSDTDVDIIPRF